jgi:hypothetical protein
MTESSQVDSLACWKKSTLSVQHVVGDADGRFVGIIETDGLFDGTDVVGLSDGAFVGDGVG